MSAGSKVCEGGPERPCYKIAYFHDVSSRVAFGEARRACEVEGGELLSIESPAEQTHVEHLLQVRDPPTNVFKIRPEQLYFSQQKNGIEHVF